MIRRKEDRPEAAEHSRPKTRNQRRIDFLRSTARTGLISKPEVIARAFPEPGERGFDILESGSAFLRPSFAARSTRAFYLD